MSKAYRLTRTIPACVTEVIGPDDSPVAASSTPLALVTNRSVIAFTRIRWPSPTSSREPMLPASLEAQRRFRHRFGAHRMQSPKPPLAPMEQRQRFGEIFLPKIRPHPLPEMQLGVGAFPQQEVGQPLLAAGADHEIDVAKPYFAGDQF